MGILKNFNWNLFRFQIMWVLGAILLIPTLFFKVEVPYAVFLYGALCVLLFYFCVHPKKRVEMSAKPYNQKLWLGIFLSAAPAILVALVQGFPLWFALALQIVVVTSTYFAIRYEMHFFMGTPEKLYFVSHFDENGEPLSKVKLRKVNEKARKKWKKENRKKRIGVDS